MLDDNNNNYDQRQPTMVMKSLHELCQQYQDEFDRGDQGERCARCHRHCGQGNDAADDDNNTNNPFHSWTSYLPFWGCFCFSNLIYLLTASTLNRKCAAGEQRSKKMMNDTMAGLVSVLVTTPLWVTNSRLKDKRRRCKRKQGDAGEDQQQQQQHRCNCARPTPAPIIKSYLEQMLTIGRHEGVDGLYGGLDTSLLLTVLSSPLNTLAMELLLRKQNISPKTNHIQARLMLMSVVSRCLVTALTYPLHLVQSHQRHCAASERPTLSTALKDIVHQQGARGLYQGIELKLVQTSLLAGLVAITQPRLVILLVERLLGSRRPRSK